MFPSLSVITVFDEVFISPIVTSINLTLCDSYFSPPSLFIMSVIFTSLGSGSETFEALFSILVYWIWINPLYSAGCPSTITSSPSSNSSLPLNAIPALPSCNA